MRKRFTLSATRHGSRRALRPALLFAVTLAAIVAPFVATRSGALSASASATQQAPVETGFARHHVTARRHVAARHHRTRKRHGGRRRGSAHTLVHAPRRGVPSTPVPAAVPAPVEGVFEYCLLDTEMSTCTQRLTA